MKKREIAFSNTKIAIIFFAFLAVIVALSLMFKAVLLVKDSKFAGSNRFIIAISNNRSTEVLSLSPSDNSIAVLKLDKSIKLNQAGQFLKVPLDGFIAVNSLDLDQKVSSLFLKTIVGFRDLKTNLTIVDLLKLSLFARGVSESAIDKLDVPLDLKETDIVKIARLTSDELIEKDKQTIRVINGTDVSGLGNRLARFITNMGGDVIIVATSDVPYKKSEIRYIDKKTYTVEKLSKTLGYEAIKSSEDVISDITVIIGEDKANSSVF